MSSASRLDVVLSASARAFLESLDKRRQTALALHLTTFYKNARPPQSRALAPSGKPVENERVWNIGEYEVVYRIGDDGCRVEIGIIRFR